MECRGAEDSGGSCAAVGFVAYEATRPMFGTAAPAFRADMDFGAEAALTTAERFGLRAPGVGPSRMLVRPDNGAIHIMDSPVELSRVVTPLLDRCEEAGPDACLAPAIEAAGNGRPGAIPLGQVPPGGACAEDPQDTIQDATMVGGWAT